MAKNTAKIRCILVNDFMAWSQPNKDSTVRFAAYLISCFGFYFVFRFLTNEFSVAPAGLGLFSTFTHG
jgi:hypothetical protein